MEPHPLSFAAEQNERWTAVLYTAHELLLRGEKIHILAEGYGREVFRLPLSVGGFPIGGGWIALHRLTGAPVLPLFRRLEDRRFVITIHAPLPPLGATPDEGLDAWREHLTRLVEEYVRRHPEQCPHLALVLQIAGPGAAGASP